MFPTKVAQLLNTHRMKQGRNELFITEKRSKMQFFKIVFIFIKKDLLIKMFEFMVLGN